MSSGCRFSRRRSCSPAAAIAELRRELLIAAGPGEWRAALLEDGACRSSSMSSAATAAGRQHPSRPGRAPVAGARRGAVDIGDERPGFLPVAGRPTRAALDEGARVSCRSGARRSRERARASPPALTRGLAVPISEQLAAEAARSEPPRQLDPPPGFAAALALRLPAAPEQVLTDDAGDHPRIARALFRRGGRASPAEDWPIDLDAEFDAALAPSLRACRAAAASISPRLRRRS